MKCITKYLNDALREEHLEGSGHNSIFLWFPVRLTNSFLETLGSIQSNFVGNVRIHKIEHFVVSHQVVEDSITVIASALISTTWWLGEENGDHKYKQSGNNYKCTENYLICQVNASTA